MPAYEGLWVSALWSSVVDISAVSLPSAQVSEDPVEDADTLAAESE
ncbi:hypothetical protein [Shewanella sp. NIFS-20-20]|nr:hypothetical protein [Shewanella sp. NIFS-20-20]MBV7314092.1 hypothetical protein [Shewanella sp. NIFS-20-20]